MKKSLLLIAVVCLTNVQLPVATARDVQTRERNEDIPSVNVSNNSSASSSKFVTNTQHLSTEERLSRLERILENQGLVEMLARLDNLQSELQILRGEIELHAHELEEIKQRQRDLYVDIDRRLLLLERSSPEAGAALTSPAAKVGDSGKSADTTKATAVAPAATAVSATDFEGEQKAYQSAFDLLRDLRYDQAVAAFKSFLKQYPNGRYAHIAQYWIGEANYAQRNFKQAITDYQTLIDKYPNSPKLAEAMLKIGYSHYELKNMKQAETTLKSLVKNYPGTTEAGQAENLLQKIRLKR